MSCEQLDPKTRCPFDANAPTAWNPGGVNRFFQSLVDNPAYQQKNLQVHWSPDKPFRNKPGPWVVTIDDFLSPEECQRMILLGHQLGFERSKETSRKKRFDGTHEWHIDNHRTSSTAWCNHTKCLEDPVAKEIFLRIETLTGIPSNNSEYLQLLKYEVSSAIVGIESKLSRLSLDSVLQETQKYGQHHDYIQYHAERSPGPRILTVVSWLFCKCLHALCSPIFRMHSHN